MRPRPLIALACWTALLAAPLRAQEPATPPPPATGEGEAGLHVHELLPGIGTLGAQVGLSLGASWNPYQVGRGVQGAGYVDLPIFSAPGGKVSYQILVALSHAESDPFTVTDAVAFVANLAAGASREAALAGPPQAPFPVVRPVRTRMRVLQVSPFGLKYTLIRPVPSRLRPYLAAGLDVVVVITQQRPVEDGSLLFTGTAPFDAPLIGGQVAQAPELEARGYPSGQGNIELGAHGGAGFELRLSRALSLNVDYRFTAIGSGGRLHALGSSLGFHW